MNTNNEPQQPKNSTSLGNGTYISDSTAFGGDNKLKGLCHVMMFIGGIITFVRNFVCNVFFVLILFLLCCLFSFIGNVTEEKTKVLNEFADEIDVDVNPSENALLYFELRGPITEEAVPDDEYSQFARMLNQRVNNFYSSDIISLENAFDLASKSDNIKGVYLKLSNMSATLEVALRLRAAIEKFKEQRQDVKITAFSESYSPSSYLVASGCDEIVLDPLGDFSFKGFSMSNLYYKSLLERFRVEPQIFRAGEFKSAVEPFIRDNMSEGVKAEYEHIFLSMWQYYKEQLLKKRERAVAYFEELYDNPEHYLQELSKASGSEAKLLKQYGVVDELKSALDLQSDFAKTYGYKKTTLHPNFLDYEKFLASENTLSPNDADKSLAVIYGVGEIVDESELPSAFTPKNIAAQIDKILKDDKICGVIFYIDSPGGSVTASEKIRRLILKLKSERQIPVYVSMNSLCASGGYWVSTACDRMYATRETITGSIGVFALGFGVHELLNEYGVFEDGVASSELSQNPLAKKMPESQKRMYTLEIGNYYETFIGLVKNSRKMLEQVSYRDYAEGKVFLAEEAKKLHLIDGIATLKEVASIMESDLNAGKTSNTYQLKHISGEGSIDFEMFKSIFIKTSYDYLGLDTALMLRELLRNRQSDLLHKAAVRPKVMALGNLKDVRF